MSAQVLPDWPPNFSRAQINDLTRLATPYALANGLLHLTADQAQSSTPFSAIHAPFTLCPSPFPRHLFQLALRLQPIFNVLYARIALDYEYLALIFDGEKGMGMADDFVGKLWACLKQLREEGLAQPLQLGLFRSDYLLHTPLGEPMVLKQVEFNTISVAFGSLSERVAALHRHLYASCKYYNASPHLLPENMPMNCTSSGFVEGLVAAHSAYGNDGSYVLFVTRSEERNFFDQLAIENQLLENHSIRVIRRTLEELSHCATVDPDTFVLRILCSLDLHPTGFVEISTVYYRAGYDPKDYPTTAYYSTRLLLERSKAIKCPSIAAQLVGCKKIQEELTKFGILERFLCDREKWGNNVFSPEDVQILRQSFMDMWSLDMLGDVSAPNLAEHESSGILKARQMADSLVLKPQREGGGNNIYKESILPFLDNLPPEEYGAWTAMKLISPPTGLANYLIRANSDENLRRVDVVTELGVYGWVLFGNPKQPLNEKVAGWLARTKGKETHEGGVEAGAAVLDSIFLVDIC